MFSVGGHVSGSKSGLGDFFVDGACFGLSQKGHHHFGPFFGSRKMGGASVSFPPSTNPQRGLKDRATVGAPFIAVELLGSRRGGARALPALCELGVPKASAQGDALGG